jgi:hypothetical protein
MVDHEGGGVEEIFVERGQRLRREVGFGEGLFHELDPAVTGAFVYLKGCVAHAEAGVTALVAVGGGAAETLDEEEAEAFFGAGEVVLGVERAEDVVGADAAVEGGDQAVEAFVADAVVDLIFGKGGSITAHNWDNLIH